MSSHNTKSSFSYHKTPVADNSAVEEARVISMKLTSETNLSIDDDMEQGCDPYNTTGQHIILRQKKLPKK